MPKVYGSMLCPDCVEAKEYFEKVNYKYEFVNITESMKNLKEFLALRENRKEFDDANDYLPAYNVSRAPQRLFQHYRTSQ